MTRLGRSRIAAAAGLALAVCLGVWAVDWLGQRVFPADPPVSEPMFEVLAAVSSQSLTLIEEQVTIQAGRVIGEYLSAFRLDSAQIHRLIEQVRPVHDLARIRAGQMLTARLGPGRVLEGLRYEIDDRQYLDVRRTAEGWSARRETHPFETRLIYAEGVVDTHLFQAVADSGETPALAVALSELFAWDVDFYADLRRGDGFRVLVEKRFLDGQFRGYGDILAAEFVNQGRPFHAIRHQTPGRKADYYTPAGLSVRRDLLKSPLKMGRITSRFTHRRLHPVAKVYRPHHGVDIAAPVGTLVHAAGNGQVTFAGRRGAAGLMVELRHPNRLTTQYLHLSRFARGVRVGTAVSQGQVIGYVGSTGESTGPHLDYRVKVNGVYVNPLKQQFRPGEPLPAEQMAAFGRQVVRCLRVLGAPPPAREGLLAGLTATDIAPEGEPATVP